MCQNEELYFGCKAIYLSYDRSICHSFIRIGVPIFSKTNKLCLYHEKCVVDKWAMILLAGIFPFPSPNKVV